MIAIYVVAGWLAVNVLCVVVMYNRKRIRPHTDQIDIVTDPRSGKTFAITRYVPPANPVNIYLIHGALKRK